MAGALLCTLNIRHDSALVAVLLRHSGTNVLFADEQFLQIAQGACQILSKKGENVLVLVLIQDPLAQSVSGKKVLEYEDVVAMGISDFQVIRPNNESDAIAVNYTSGTTSSPKGVVYKIEAKMKARQGVNHLGIEEIDVKDPVTMKSLTADGVAMGEIVFRGNTVMNGYLKNPEATKEAFKRGWFWSGDLGVKHLDGYIELNDRTKDIIISGGENISPIEVESVLFTHPCVLEAAVVGRPDEYWGETACAFVKLKDGTKVNAEEIISYCREQIPHYMAPRSIVFEDLPKTSTGKVQKFVLRTKAKALGSLSKKGSSKL